MIRIALLWHMHQPSYLDPDTDSFSMPWVRMHAIKGYYDMARLVQQFPDLRIHFNLVPSLVEQIEWYAAEAKTDAFLQVTEKPADALREEDCKFILSNFFMCNWQNMIYPYPRYRSLLERRGLDLRSVEMDGALRKFSVQDLRDLQVWFNLTWFGYEALKTYPELGALRKKGRNFSEEDKAVVVACQREILEKILPLYRELQESGQVEITASPYYHPILPLLIDSDSAQRAMPEARLPAPFRFPEDAGEQIAAALRKHEQVFGRRPRGMWPSEGSVSPEAVALLAAAGVEWVVTDEGILLNTIRPASRDDVLYRPYRVPCGPRTLAMLFRDKILSDAIGFHYSRMHPQEAFGDFCAKLRDVAARTGGYGENRLVTVALDGENAWEYYPDGGEQFLRSLYGKLAGGDEFRSVGISETLAGFQGTGTIGHPIWTGSWIGQNFDIWIGSTEENAAWTLLREARQVAARCARQKEDPAALERARRFILRAEGSDWFWWYGDDFSTDNDIEFDRLFRANICQIYRSLGLDPPSSVSKTLLVPRDIRPAKEPSGFIHPVINGRLTDFFEWSGAGVFTPKRTGGAQIQTEGVLKNLHFGFNLDTFFLRMDIATPENLKGEPPFAVAIRFLQPVQSMLYFFLANGEKELRLLPGAQPEETAASRVFDSIRIDKIVELSIPFAALNLKAGEQARFFVSILQRERELERYPQIGTISFQVPDGLFESRMWSV
jgi:alpha-amylase/alpha-mannosidase (GH57 family)